MWARVQFDRWVSEAASKKDEEIIEKETTDEENNEAVTGADNVKHPKEINKENHNKIKMSENSEIRSCL